MPPSDLNQANEILHLDPARAAEICREALNAGADPGAQLMLAAALRLQGDFVGAEKLARAVAVASPHWAGAHFELGMALAGLGRAAEALDVFHLVERLGVLPGLYRHIGDQHWRLGNKAAAESAYLRHLAMREAEPLVHAAFAPPGSPDLAERMLRLQLSRNPTDVLAMRLLAELLSSQRRYDEAEHLLRSCLERVPSFELARYGLAMVLFTNHEPAAALEQVEALLTRDPNCVEYLNLKADVLATLGDFSGAVVCLRAVISIRPDDAATWSNYGHLLRALGERVECEATYKRAIALRPDCYEAYWGLANLKTFRFDQADIDAMSNQLQRSDPSADTTPLHFALGKALEDKGDLKAAFAAYSGGNTARRVRHPYDRRAPMESTRRRRELFSSGFFRECSQSGSAENDPIFIVGMPRSGSTLVEQILASHSSVEGTMELVEVLAIANRLGATAPYPELLAGLSANRFLELGKEYLKRTRVYRRTSAPRFVDKMPNNFAEIGLIHLMLPNAAIIDVRRHPLSCCLSIFKQHWATGQEFAYDLEDIGHYYRCYVELMAHFDAVLPGRVHRVLYEDLVNDTEGVTRRLLGACNLPFEDQCLRFYENRRPVRTPSSEQVRQSIFTSGLDNWSGFERWLEPLKSALGPVLEAYPAAPPLSSPA